MEENIKDKEADEFKAAYDKYATLVLNSALSYLSDRYLSEDVMQEVMFKFYIKRQKEVIVNEQTWLMEVTKCLCLNILRDMYYEYAEEKAGHIQDIYHSDKTSALNAEEIHLKDDRQDEMEQLCQEIFKELKRKKYKRWYPIAEVLYRGEETERAAARRLGMTEDSFYSSVKRMRKHLKKKYGERYADIENV